MNQSYNISGIVLAAGRSSRMQGTQKLTLPFGESTVLEQVVGGLLQNQLKEVLVVVGQGRTVIEGYLKNYPIRLLNNPNHDEGMATSIRVGVAEVSAASDGFLIALGDMPMIKPSSIAAICQAFSQGQSGQIVAPFFDEKRGHPVIFCRSYREELLTLKGDRGANSIIRKHPRCLRAISTNDPGIHQDIDNRLDYLRHGPGS